MRTGPDAPLGVLGGIVIFPGSGIVRVRTVLCHKIQYNEAALMKDMKQNIRYLGFESIDAGDRRFDFAITTTGHQATRVSLVIPALMFTGVNKITFQESAKI